VLGVDQIAEQQHHIVAKKCDVVKCSGKYTQDILVQLKTRYCGTMFELFWNSHARIESILKKWIRDAT
jgi:hypothetical protein